MTRASAPRPWPREAPAEEDRLANERALRKRRRLADARAQRRRHKLPPRLGAQRHIDRGLPPLCLSLYDHHYLCILRLAV